MPKFNELYSKLKRNIEITGKSQSTLTNYGRCLATMALHFNCSPLELDQEQVLDYLHYLKTLSKTPSSSYFKHTVYGLSFAYKVMGLAPYGEPRYVQTIYDHLIDLKEDGSFKMNMEYFDYCAGLRMTNGKFAKLFGGPAREPESKLTQREMDLARSLQEVTEEVMLRMTRHVQKETGEKNLVMAGGVALNCVGNGRILREGPFENIWIQPAAGDAGGALGAALFVWYRYLSNPRSVTNGRDSQRGSYLGPDFDDDQIEHFLKMNEVPYRKLDREELLEALRNDVGALDMRLMLQDARMPCFDTGQKRGKFKMVLPSFYGTTL